MGFDNNIPCVTLKMLKLLCVVLLYLQSSAEPRSPRIYNVLISSKKNLSPSHAQPVYEPVLRTTSIGYAFPTLIYHSPFVPGFPFTYIHPGFPEIRRVETSYFGQESPRYPLPFSYNQKVDNIPQPNLQQTSQRSNSEGYAENFDKYLPKDNGNAPVNNRVSIDRVQDEADPKTVVANLKTNPEIPDVPPPPLPVKTSPTK
ncbi:uncharacterized protein LOC115876670 isoform X2 [Sitophilus oryzae]|uniref:Uncharacterized protein LOC115876670 isoform X2 n=1 Tax=Sitophilus oryzae TaxID=7048 RepID=A0A6J2XBR6_SITOR|nr:uncharacterized protein LOC115876670 isoform X2 [Sitophilus oryzae]